MNEAGIKDAIREAQRLRNGIEALYKFVATKWPEADDVLDEIQALIAKREGDADPRQKNPTDQPTK